MKLTANYSVVVDVDYESDETSLIVTDLTTWEPTTVMLLPFAISAEQVDDFEDKLVKLVRRYGRRLKLSDIMAE